VLIQLNPTLDEALAPALPQDIAELKYLCRNLLRSQVIFESSCKVTSIELAGYSKPCWREARSKVRSKSPGGYYVLTQKTLRIKGGADLKNYMDRMHERDRQLEIKSCTIDYLNVLGF
jgi:hypothetical protein